MCEIGISVNRTPDLATASFKAYGVLEQAADDLGKHFPEAYRPRISIFS